MSKNNVKVTVKLVDKFSKTLKRLEGQLDKIDKKKVRPRFRIDDGGQIERLKAELATIDDIVNVKLNVLGKPALKETQASVKSLSGVENVYVRTHDHELTQTIAKMEALRRRNKIRKQFSAQDEFLSNVRRRTRQSKRLHGIGTPKERAKGATEKAQDSARRSRRALGKSQFRLSAQDEFLSNVRRRTRQSKRLHGIGTPKERAKGTTGKAQDSARRSRRALDKSQFRLSDLFYADSRFRGKDGPVGSVTGFDFDDLDERFGGRRRRKRRGRGILDRVRSFLPDGGDGVPGKEGGGQHGPKRGWASWVMWRLIPRGQLTQDLAAFFMPFMFTAYTAAMGAFAAALGPAIAGIGALSLGILGFGENAADSLKLAEVRLRIFGRELHKVFKPVTSTFAPFVDQWFKTLPHSLSRELSEPLQGMVVWMPTVEAIGGGLLAWTRDFLNLMNEMEPVISRLVMMLGADVGDALLRFFAWLINELETNYELIKSSLGAFKELAIFVYRLSVLWTQAIANLSPLIKLIGKLATAIASHQILGPIVSWIIALAIVGAVVWKILGLFAMLTAFVAGPFITSVLASMTAAIAATWAWVAALSAAAKMALLTGIGLVALVGGAIALGKIDLPSSSPDDFQTPGPGGHGGQHGNMSAGSNTINIYGNPDNTQIQQFKDMFPGMHEGEMNINDRMSQG